MGKEPSRFNWGPAVELCMTEARRLLSSWLAVVSWVAAEWLCKWMMSFKGVSIITEDGGGFSWFNETPWPQTAANWPFELDGSVTDGRAVVGTLVVVVVVVVTVRLRWEPGCPVVWLRFFRCGVLAALLGRGGRVPRGAQTDGSPAGSGWVTLGA